MRSFRKFSEQQAAAEVQLGRIVMLPLILENEGSVTGKDVRLRLHLSSKVQASAAQLRDNVSLLELSRGERPCIAER